jgi:sensor histidine kinase YesM
MAVQDPAALSEMTLPRQPRAGFLVAWCVFWLLLTTVGVQDHLRRGHTDIWKPLLWEGTSFLVASGIAWLHWRRLHRLDALLTRPLRWFAAALVWLPPAAVAFVAVVYALRHGAFAAVGEIYRHEAWSVVFRYETLKFSLFYLLFVAIVFGFRSHAALSAARVRAERALALSQEAKLLQLTQQIEPHFLFNALNTIASTIHTDPNLADTLLLRLAALLRAATDLTRRPEVPLAEELKLLEGYAAIMQERFKERCALRFEFDPEAAACRVPTLVLQPLLENAFRHGVEARSERTTICVRTRRADARLILEVENDGELAPQPAPGVGLSNLRQRLAVRYGERALLALAARAGGGVAARIELPCEC